MNRETSSKMVNLFGVTNEFLEGALNRKWGSKFGNNLQVDHFNLSQGSLQNEGYTTMLLAVQVWLKECEQILFEIESNFDLLFPTPKEINEDPSLNLVIKCYPENKLKQHYLESSDIFRIELGVYETVMPELVKFQKEDLKLDKIIWPPIPYFVAGQALTLQEMGDLKKTRPLEPLDNYVMMVDMRKHGNFFMRNPFLGLDLDHHKLTIEAQATLHAMSWAYKVKKGLTHTHLRSKFPFLQKGQMQDNLQMMTQLLKTNLQVCKTIVHHELEGDPVILKGLEDLENKILTAFVLYYEYDPKFDPDSDAGNADELMDLNPKKYTKDSILRIPRPTSDDEDPWLVLIHGDAWSNNIMFNYAADTKKPIQAILLDFQISREGDPLSDLVYALYMGTTRDYRSSHMDTILRHYFDTFLSTCDHLSVPPLPGFTWPEFLGRFHRTKMYGLVTAILSLPIILKNPAISDYEAILSLSDSEECRVWADSRLKEAREKQKKNIGVVRKRLFQPWNAEAEYEKINPVMKLRISGLLRDMVDDGVL